MKNRPWKKTALLAILFLLLVPTVSLADETPAAAPTNLGTAEVGVGYRGTSVAGGGETLSPYEDTESGALIWFDLYHYFPSRTSVLLQGAWTGEDWYRIRGDVDWQGDVVFGFNSTRFPGNREHESIAAPSSTDEEINFTDQDPNATYQANINETTASLRFRIPTYPAHIRVDARQYRITGDRQMIFLDENCTSNCHLVSQTRSMNTVTNQVTIETDAHLGPIDAAYSFLLSRFRDEEDNPEWGYGIKFGVRNPGPGEHDVLPGITTREHTLTLSTSNTRSQTAAMPPNRARRDNDDTQLALDYGTVSGSFFWRPLRTVSLVGNYRRFEKDEDASDAVAALRTAAGIAAEINSVENRYSTTLSYYPIKGVRLQGYYTLKDLKRESAASWEVDKIDTNTWKVSTQIKPFNELVVDLYYQRQTTDHPLYIIDPTERSDRYAAVNLQPWTQVLLQVSFLSTRAKNDENGVWTGTSDAESERDNRRDILQSGITFTFSQPVTLGFYYSMFSDAVDQDLYLGASDALYANADVPYNSRGDEFMAQASWRPVNPLELKAEVSYLEATGHYRVDTTPYADLGTFTQFEAQQWRGSLQCDYTFSHGLKLGTRLGYTSYDDQISPENNEIIREIVVSISKRW